MSQHESLVELRNGHNINAPIEILEAQQRPTAIDSVENQNEANITRQLNSAVEWPNGENENDLKLNADGHSNDTGAENTVVAVTSMELQSQPSSSSNTQKQFKRKYPEYTAQCTKSMKNHQLVQGSSKPFKGDHVAKCLHNIKSHQRIHKAIKPFDCDQQFTNPNSLTRHLITFHKNNQRWLNCKRCMRRFAPKSESESQTIQCNLCKKYFDREVETMRKHSAVCSKRFS